ncbi:hypothetical protein ADH76_11185 [Enterocloster clostridioformis]|uniref:hypothetical protein n=1 Tax=Enterocloster clostridioformis TaxID=1531 RepID=UPI00080C4DDE|nr:hypothetical protein [Enterocloster clostridioformis]ANU48320.1 hypothetical protein A4V08_23425 [Lachnoclostridium sp. YL32]NDO29435.1 hypothetical protein [Enterocloster clostridioformis]OXE68974.1 hypothetical protein ADH76_11185 [Enterocloster clostridioformis]QQR02792.1 hypothetical protein I5Q83_11385 [Enterocloster clostridioformis]
MYLLILVIACIFDFILEKIKDFKLYYYGLDIIPYTRYELVSSLEKILYRITSIGQRIPYLIYKPHVFEMQILRSDQQMAVSIQEKILIFFELIIKFLSLFIGIRITYIVMAFVWLWEKFKNQIINIVKILLEIDYLNKVQNVYQYIIDNGSALLLVIIALLSLYIMYIKKKFIRYEFEEIWFKEESEKIKEIADKQIEISKLLLEIRSTIYENCNECSLCIRQIDFYIKHSQGEECSLRYNFKEYDSIVDELKGNIKYIEDNNGKRLFKKYNKDIWFQLFMLELTDSSNQYNWNGIGSCSKKEIERNLNDFSFDKIKRTRKLMFHCWTGCISTINGIERYLYYISKRRRKHGKLQASLNSVINIKEFVNDIKEKTKDE